uniref:Venom dipeptidyl peptidase 4 n=1 Tax=Acrobeloides nanus TaxID=290746 RepID=A0A914DNK1_9BILA
MWAEPDDYSIKFYTRDSYFVLLPHRRANNNVYTQIARVSVKPDFSTGRETFLQMGDYDVEKIHAFDDENSKIYFTAAAPIPSQRHLFVTHAKAELDNAITANCITCQMETNCTFHEVNFSPRGKNFYLNCKGPGTPHMMLSSIESNFSILGEYGRNSVLESMTRSHLFPRVLYENVTLSNGHVSMVKMLLPYGLDRQAVDKHYPVLVDVYGGPGTQKVTEEWFSNNIDIYFASSKEYVIVFIDGRGSGYRGWRQKQPLYGNLGTVEVDDQIETISALLKRHRFLDSRNVAIWGWSYGGFVSARVVQRDPKRIFKCAISIAPVTNFKYYGTRKILYTHSNLDATYTERYMGTASSEAYQNTDLSRNVSAFHNVKYLLAHGTGDENVHFQNTAEFVKALTSDNVQFELMIYPDESHNLFSGRWHLYNMLDQFLNNCFHTHLS